MFSISPIIARHWPFANGSGRIVDRYVKDIDLGSGELVAQTSDGFAMRVLADDLIGRHLLVTGKFDRSIVQVLLDHAKPGDTLLDVGANIGYVSACFLAKVKDSKSIAVEPQPGVVDLLKKNLAQFGPRATVHAVALSDAGGDLRFHIDHGNRGGSRISPDGEVVVPAISAPELLAGVERVDLIKIDVEGHEERVLNSMRSEIIRLKPRAILFEDHGHAAAIDEPLGQIFADLGYIVHGIDKRLLSTKLPVVKLRSDCRFNDYLAERSSSPT